VLHDTSCLCRSWSIRSTSVCPERRHVSSRLVRPPDDIMMLHQINCIFVMSRISKAIGKFPSTHKRVHYLGHTRLWRWSFNIICPTEPRAPTSPSTRSIRRVLCFLLSLRALLVAYSLPPLKRQGLWDISAQHFKKQKVNDFIHTNIVPLLTI